MAKQGDVDWAAYERDVYLPIKKDLLELIKEVKGCPPALFNSRIDTDR